MIAAAITQHSLGSRTGVLSLRSSPATASTSTASSEVVFHLGALPRSAIRVLIHVHSARPKVTGRHQHLNRRLCSPERHLPPLVPGRPPPLLARILRPPTSTSTAASVVSIVTWGIKGEARKNRLFWSGNGRRL